MREKKGDSGCERGASRGKKGRKNRERKALKKTITGTSAGSKSGRSRATCQGQEEGGDVRPGGGLVTVPRDDRYEGRAGRGEGGDLGHSTSTRS